MKTRGLGCKGFKRDGAERPFFFSFFEELPLWHIGYACLKHHPLYYDRLGQNGHCGSYMYAVTGFISFATALVDGVLLSFFLRASITTTQKTCWWEGEWEWAGEGENKESEALD